MLLSSMSVVYLPAQQAPVKLWHDQQRVIHYQPDGKDFVKIKGTRRFNRALYGSNTGFRAEAGDLPEFALYLPGMGGNFKLGLVKGDSSKWIINARDIQTKYRPGSMLYTIKDDLLNEGTLSITAMALYEMEGLIVKVEAKSITTGTQLIAGFGGATGTRFSREGDIGADPESSFYLKPEYCRDNGYQIAGNTFNLFYGSKKPLTEEERYEIQHFPGQQKDSSKTTVPQKLMSGIFPVGTLLKVTDAATQESPAQFFSGKESATPALVTNLFLKSDSVYYFLIINGKIEKPVSYSDLPQLFNTAEEGRKKIADRVIINTPDPYINTLGGALSIAADAVWESPSFMHGAVAWRMRLNGWRGAYAADVFGWHDRAREHFSSYALSQLTTAPGPVVMDTVLHLARSQEKLGTALFSDGYICRNPNGDFRPHHYDMNLGFIDQLLNHFMWTGDTAYVKKMWSLLTRHLSWEKRNFDMDGDGLYDAYAAIWASDAMQYSGGGVTHTSAYNYRANKMAAELAKLIGKDPSTYDKEARKILKAMNDGLWMRSKGWYAEYKDLLGKKLQHPAAGLWTVYHAMESGAPTAFQAYQLLKYVDTEIPRIPIRATGLNDTSLYTISTTNWQPYDWSLNNVVLAEVLHTALAYWQGGRNEEAYTLWKSALVESMYIGASPGNIQQLSFYDAIRGELYRDFADDIGMAARSLVEGLFGVLPDVLRDTLYIKPGFPAAWDQASIHTPDIDFSFKQKGNTDFYAITTRFPKKLNLSLQARGHLDKIEMLTVNGKKVNWVLDATTIGYPVIKINAPAGDNFNIEIKWSGNKTVSAIELGNIPTGQSIKVTTANAVIKNVYDPQHSIDKTSRGQSELRAVVKAQSGTKTFFVEVRQGQVSYWVPVSFTVGQSFGINGTNEPEGSRIVVQNNTNTAGTGRMYVNNVYQKTITVAAHQSAAPFWVSQKLLPGTSVIRYESGKNSFSETVINWDIKSPAFVRYDKIDLSAYFNDEVSNIFKNQYLSP
ncbi:MAG: DUF4450 domain-containing protein, partial [Chitinophagaceae bacterium]